jgi:hypothetical protein
MAIPDRNIRRPLRPVDRQDFPRNRVMQTVDGVRMRVGSVIPVGRDPNESWVSLAVAHQLRPWEIIWANFETDVPEEVNWYLRHYVMPAKPVTSACSSKRVRSMPAASTRLTATASPLRSPTAGGAGAWPVSPRSTRRRVCCDRD